MRPYAKEVYDMDSGRYNKLVNIKTKAFVKDKSRLQILYKHVSNVTNCIISNAFF